MKLKKKNSGMALPSALAMSLAVILTTSAVAYKVVSSTKNIVRIKNMDLAKNIADEGTEHVIDWLNARNNSSNYPIYGAAAQDILMDPSPSIGMTIDNFISPLNTITLGTSTYVNSYNTPADSVYKSTSNTITAFRPIVGLNLISTLRSVSSITDPLTNITNSVISSIPNNVIKELNASTNVMTFESLDKKGEFQVGIEKIPTTVSRYDLIKVVTVAYVPSRTADNKAVRKYVTIVQRPKDVRISLDNAILSQGAITMGNGDTDAGTSVAEALVRIGEGDIFSNTSITLSSGSVIDGAVKSAGAVTGPTTGVSGAVSPSIEPLPVPKLNYKTPTEIAALPNCNTSMQSVTVNGSTDNYTTYTGPCKVTNMVGQNIQVKNDVYLLGDLSLSGQQKIISGGTTPGMPSSMDGFSMLIASGNVSTQGNASSISPSPNKLGISTYGGSLSLSGNGQMNILFFNDNPLGDVTIGGNGTIFGGIISRGGVNFNGNAEAKIIRDTGLQYPPFKLEAGTYTMRLLSSKEIQVNN